MRIVFVHWSAVLALLAPTLMFTDSVDEIEAPSDASAVLAFQKIHKPLGASELTLVNDVLTVQPTDDSKFGVAVPVGVTKALNISLNPIDIPVGRSFTAAFRTDSGIDLAVVEHVQTGPTTTDLFLSLEQVSSRIVGAISLETYAEGEQTYAGTLETLPLQRIGNVESATGSWAKTYHVLCEEGRCTVFIDPDETTLQLDGSDHPPIPFNFIKVSFKVDFDATPSAIELIGNGVPAIEIIDETDEPLTF